MGRRIWDYIASLDGADSLDKLATLFLGAARRLGYPTVGLVSHAHPSTARDRGLFITAGQDAWIERYEAEGYHRVDPFQRASRRRSTPFRLSDAPLDPSNALQQRMLTDMGAAGLGDGLAIPIRTPGELPATCVYFGAESIAPEDYGLAHAVAVFTHAAGCRLLAKARGPAPAALTPTECECLAWLARGKSEREIATLLSLSPRTVHHTVERAKKRLGVSSRLQAVVLALHEGLLSIDEVIA